MAKTVLIKVEGFNDVERHSLNTLFRLSVDRSVAYALWTDQCPQAPDIALIDQQSAFAQGSPHDATSAEQVRTISVGDTPNPAAWKWIQRPVDWTQLLATLDSLFSPPAVQPNNIDFTSTVRMEAPAQPQRSLLVGLLREEAMYLRARLALMGLTHVDEAQTASLAIDLIQQVHFDVVVISLDLPDADPWSLVQTLQEIPVPVAHIIVTTDALTPQVITTAHRAGCLGVLEIPFIPLQVAQLLQSVKSA